MSATIIKLGAALSTPNGIKVRTDILEYPQTLLLHDFSKSKTYPAQVSPVTDGTEFVNLSKSGAFPSEGFVAVKSAIPYSAEGKCLTMTKLVGGSALEDKLLFGTAAAPFPQLVATDEKSDILVIVWVKISHAQATTGTVIQLASTSGTANANMQFKMQYGGTGAGIMTLVFNGSSIANVNFTPDVWTQLALYGRHTGYNGKTKVARTYKNGVIGNTVTTDSGTFATFLATDTNTPLEIGDAFSGSIGRVAIMKGLDAAGLDPTTLVAQDYTYGSKVWLNP